MKPPLPRPARPPRRPTHKCLLVEHLHHHHAHIHTANNGIGIALTGSTDIPIRDTDTATAADDNRPTCAGHMTEEPHDARDHRLETPVMLDEFVHFNSLWIFIWGLQPSWVSPESLFLPEGIDLTIPESRTLNSCRVASLRLPRRSCHGGISHSFGTEPCAYYEPRDDMNHYLDVYALMVSLTWVSLDGFGAFDGDFITTCIWMAPID